MTPPTVRYDLGWRHHHVLAIWTAAAVALVVLAVGWSRRPLQLSAQPPAWQDRIEQAREEIDPNTAAAGSLMRLPGVGRVTADAIIRYRTEHQPRAFRTVEDLDKVPGIALPTCAKLAPYLDLPTAAETTSGSKSRPSQN